MANTEEFFREALKGKKLPILTLDNKWHQLFTKRNKDKEVDALAKELTDLVAKQGGMNQEIKDLMRLKKRLMEEIVSGIDGEPLSDKEMNDHKRLIEECNEKIDVKQDELLDYPKAIDEVNFKLMIKTMSVCYDALAVNTEEINEIAEWITNIRIELKKNVIRKQEKEVMNQQLYAYMHNIFGPEVIDIFDMKYNPDENQIKK